MRSITQEKSQDVLTSNVQGVKREEKELPVLDSKYCQELGEDVCDSILSLLDKEGPEFKVG